MPVLNTLQDLLIDELKDIYSAEKLMVNALPRMLAAASHPELQAVLKKHLDQTKVHLDRIERAMKQFDASPRGKTCKAMEGLVEEGEEVIREHGAEFIKDAALISAAQKAEHYEISAYGSARALAHVLGKHDLVDLLTETLDEESQTEEDLMFLAETINSEAFAQEGL